MGTDLAAGEGAGLRGWTAPLPLPLPLVGVVGRGEGRAGEPWGTDPTIRPVLGSIRNLARWGTGERRLIVHKYS